ncbi:MAG: DUF2397 family protein, partial [Fusobacteriaceae bacterium]
TNIIINRIIKYAMKIYEDRSVSYRRDEYLYIIEKFESCKNLKEAHELSSNIFGVEGTIHLKSLEDRETEDINSSVYEEVPTNVMLYEGKRGKSNKIIKNPIKMNTELKLNKIKSILEEREKDRSKLKELSQHSSLQLKKLPILTTEQRRLILKNISRKELLSQDRVVLKSIDGDIELPDFKIEVK